VDALVRASGGLLPEANDQAINLAKVVKDGEMVYVPRKGEQNPDPLSAPGISQQGSAKVIHINSATAEELSSLTGIGEAKARAILEYRSAHGSFGDKEELKKVNGIGEKLYERIKESISVD
jgi:competence protein ComEA